MRKTALECGGLCLIAILLATPVAAGESRYDVRDFGAAPGGAAPATAAIQKAIDRCAADGGGTVYFPPGRFLSGGLVLRSNVALELEAGATLLGSTDPKDYAQRVPELRSYTDNYVRQALIYGEKLENVAIRGRGTIDGQGTAFPWREYRDRPYLIRLVECRDVFLENVHLRNSAMWMQQYLACERLVVRGISVWNHVVHNNDGIDLDACRDVMVSDCLFDADDDALCLKSTTDRPCENVTIVNCVCRSHCNAIKMGTESNGGFQNITIANCVIEPPRGTKPVYGQPRGLAGLALEIVDGGRLDGVAVSNLTMRGISVPIFMRLGNRARPFVTDGPTPPVGVFRNVTISNVVATGMSTIGCALAGILGHNIENVCLRDINLSFEGGGPEVTKPVPEKEAAYPESRMFGELPAYGFYCRHVTGLTLANVRLRTEQPDPRPALVADDVRELVVDGLNAACTPEARAVVALRDVQEAFLRAWVARGAAALLRVEGAATRRIVLGQGDSTAPTLVDRAPDAPAKEITELCRDR